MMREIDAPVARFSLDLEVCRLLYGTTANERRCTTIDKPVTMEALHATIYRALGIPPDQSFVVGRRPVYVTRDGKGVPILDLFA